MEVSREEKRQGLRQIEGSRPEDGGDGDIQRNVQTDQTVATSGLTRSQFKKSMETQD